MNNISKKQAVFVLLLLIMAIAIFFRVYKLNDIPPGLYPDIAMNGTNALQANATGVYKVFYPENNGREGMFMNIIAASFLIFGASVWAIKIVAVLFGIFTVLGLYFLTKELFAYFEDKFAAQVVALLSAFFMAIGLWHVNFSRMGFRAIMVPFFLAWALFFLLKAVNTSLNAAKPDKKRRFMIFAYWLLSGLMFGLGFNTYIAFRIAPLIAVPILIIELVRYWPRLKLGRWLTLIIGAIITAAPLGWYYLKNPADFMGRAGQVSVFATGSPIKILLLNTLKTFGQFVWAGDYNWRHNLSGSPEIFWALIPFFLIGIIYIIAQIFRKQNYVTRSYSLLTTCWTLLVAWSTMLLPAIASNEGMPHALRSIGATVPTYIFVGLGFYLFIKFISSKLKSYENRLLYYRSFGITLIIVFLLFTGVMEYISYFVIWGQNPETRSAFDQTYVDEANYLNSLPVQTTKYVIVNDDGVPVPYPDGIPVSAQTIMFLTNAHDPQNNIQYFKKDQLQDILISRYPAVILPIRPDQNIFDQLKHDFPNGTIKYLNNFEVFEINYYLTIK